MIATLVVVFRKGRDDIVQMLFAEEDELAEALAPQGLELPVLFAKTFWSFPREFSSLTASSS